MKSSDKKWFRDIADFSTGKSYEHKGLLRFSSRVGFAALVLSSSFAFADEVKKDIQPPADSSSVSFNFTVVPHGLLQVWGVSSNPEGNLLAPTGASDKTSNGVLIRRSEFSLGGKQDMGLEWGFLIDPSKPQFTSDGKPAADNKILQDLYVGYQFTKEFKIRVGQFHIPTNKEGLEPSGDLLFAERSFLGWRTGDLRDVGVAGYGTFDRFKVSLGFFNGYGINTAPGGGMHEVVGRIDADVTSEIHAGIWGNTDGGDTETLTPQKTNSGFDLSWEKGPWLVQAEAMYQWTPTTQSGYYLEGAYKWLEKNQVALRFDHYQGFSDQERDEDAGEIGYNRLFDKGNLKLQVSYKFGNVNFEGDRKFFDEMIVALQTSF